LASRGSTEWDGFVPEMTSYSQYSARTDLPEIRSVPLSDRLENLGKTRKFRLFRDFSSGSTPIADWPKGGVLGSFEANFFYSDSLVQSFSTSSGADFQWVPQQQNNRPVPIFPKAI